MTHTLRGRHEPVMGTSLDVLVTADDPQAAAVGEQAAVDEMRRREHIYSAFDPASELCRWRSGAEPEPSEELAELLAAAHRWHLRSLGTFNPAVGALSDLWRGAATTGTAPTAEECRRLAATIAEPRFDGAYPHRPLPGAQAVNFNALAKGLAVDHAAAAALTVPGVQAVTVSAGGDLRHSGSGTVRVGVEDPARPYDNAAPLTVVTLGNDMALATSGSARRGFRVGDRWYSHVIDPRSGWPVDHAASVSVVATEAGVADVLATVACVLTPDLAVAAVEALQPGAAVLVVTTDGDRVANHAWRRLAPDRRTPAELRSPRG
jgi:thiamine biosynthesis lipoprotein